MSLHAKVPEVRSQAHLPVVAVSPSPRDLTYVDVVKELKIVWDVDIEHNEHIESSNHFQSKICTAAILSSKTKMLIPLTIAVHHRLDVELWGQVRNCRCPTFRANLTPTYTRQAKRQMLSDLSNSLNKYIPFQVMSSSQPSLRQGIYPAIDPKNFKDAFKGKVVLVTGSGRGIGREIALSFSKSGASVAITGRTKAQVDQTTKDVQDVAEGGKVVGVVADGCKRSDLINLVKEVTESLGEIDVLVCNAGTNTFMPFHLTDPDEWWYSMEINVKSPVELTRIVLPSMRKRNSGTLIYTSSRAANANLPWTTAYNSSKIAITRFAGSLQAELDIVQKVEGGFPENGISTFSTHPGEIETDLHQTAFPEKTKTEAPYVIDFMAKIGKHRPHFDVGLPAWTCVYLASDKARCLRGQFVDCTGDIDETIARM